MFGTRCSLQDLPRDSPNRKVKQAPSWFRYYRLSLCAIAMKDSAASIATSDNATVGDGRLRQHGLFRRVE